MNGKTTAEPTDPQARSIVLPSGEIIPPRGGLLRPAWKKGQSGNPNGYGSVSAYHAARQICARATPAAANRQVELMSSDDERVAFMATEAVIRRGAGPVRDHSAEDEQVSKINLDALNADERKALVSLLRRALGAN